MTWWASAQAWEGSTGLSLGDDFHKPFEVDTRNVSALIAGFVVSALALAAGVGGGAFFVPLFNIVVGFGLKASTSASQAAIFGGSIASVLISLSKAHPLRPSCCVIDFDIALVTTPLLLAGVDAGVLVSPLLPSWAIALGLVVLLTYMCYRTTLKGMAMHRKEVASHGAMKTSPSALLPCAAIRYPWRKLLQLAAIWGVFLLITVAQRMWPRCSWQFAVVLTGELVLCLAAAALFMAQVHSEHNKPETNSETALLPGVDASSSVQSDMRFTVPVLVRSALGTSACGLAAGVLGLGGGMLFTPFLLDFNVQPEVATATANLLILFGSSSATVAWGVADALNLEYAAIYFVLCIAGAMTGIHVIGGYVRRSGRSSLLVFLLAAIMGCGALLTGVFGGLAFAKDVRQGHIEGFHSFC